MSVVYKNFIYKNVHYFQKNGEITYILKVLLGEILQLERIMSNYLRNSIADDATISVLENNYITELNNSELAVKKNIQWFDNIHLNF